MPDWASGVRGDRDYGAGRSGSALRQNGIKSASASELLVRLSTAWTDVVRTYAQWY